MDGDVKLMESRTQLALINPAVGVIDESVLIARTPPLSLSPEGMTTSDFIDSHVEGKSRLEIFWDFLSQILPVRPASINIFSIVDGEDGTLDIHFYVLTDTGYMQPERLHGVLAAHQKKV